MFEKLVLKNFQKHKKLVLEFSPGITTITGPTDCGKSAIFRALRFVCLNKLSGNPDNYIRWDAPGCAVAVTAGGTRVTRKRSRKKGENVYEVDGSPFRFDSAKRAGVPGGVAAVLNVGEDNFQRQFDRVFWLADGAGQIAKNLNQIVNLEVMDRCLGELNKTLRTHKTKKEIHESQVTALKEELTRTAWVKEAEGRLETVLSISERLNKKCDYLRSAGRTVQTGINARRALVIASKGLPEAKNALSAGRAVVATANKAKRLATAIEEITSLRKIVTSSIPDISPLLKVREKADAVAERCRHLESLITQATKAEEYLCVTQEELTAKKAELKRRGKSVVCPKCGRPVT